MVAARRQERKKQRKRRTPPTQPLWAEACKYTSNVINMTARVRDKPDVHSPYRKFYGRPVFARLLPSRTPGFHYVRRTLKCATTRRRAVVPSVQVETSLRLGLPLYGPCYMAEARRQEREKPRKRRSPVKLPVWRIHVRLVPNPCRHVNHVAGVLTRPSPEGLR